MTKPSRIFAAGMACCAAALMALPIAAQTPDPLSWQGTEKCGALFETPPPVLPGGSVLKKIFSGANMQSHYSTPGGGDLRITVRNIRKMPVSGATYAAAYKDLITRRPLQDSIERKVDGRAVLADVRMLTGLNYRITRSDDEQTVMINPDSLTLKLTAKVRAADWTGYADAPPEDQIKWDRHSCESYHHELGHILVSAQILEDSTPEWLALRAESQDALKTLQDALLSTIGGRIKDRQKAYHDALKDMSPNKSLSQTRPYMELPFTWLDNSSSKPVDHVQD